MTRAFRIACAALTLSALAPMARAQDDPYAGLARYDGQNRSALAVIEKSVKAAQGKPAQLAAIEVRLAALLKDPAAGFAGKQEACRILWMVGTARSVPALAALLPDAKLGDAARYALERCPAPEAGAALRAGLARLKGPALVGVINSVGNRQDPLAVGALARIARSGGAAGQAAEAALATLATPASAAALGALPARSLVGWRGIVDAARAALAARRTSRGLALAQSVLKAKGAPDSARGQALILLVGSGSPVGLTAALAALKGPSGYLQVVAARQAATARQPGAAARYAAALPGLAPAAAQALLTALGDRGDASVAPAVLAQLRSPEAGVRGAAIRAAILLAPATAAAPVAALAASGAGEDKQAATEWLRLARGAAADKAILGLAGSAEQAVRVALAPVIADRSPAEALPILMGAAAGADAAVAAASLKAAAALAGKDQVKPLVDLVLAATADEVRQGALDALAAAAGRADDAGAVVGPIVAALPTAGVEVANAFMPILADAGGVAALSVLDSRGESADAEVRRAAVAALADRWSGAEPLPMLLKVARADEVRAIRVRALRGCIRLMSERKVGAAERAADLAGAYALAERPDEKKAVLAALAGCRVPAALDVAAEALDDAALFAEAADTVVKLASGNGAVTGPAARAALEKIVAKAQDNGLRDRAKRLL